LKNFSLVTVKLCRTNTSTNSNVGYVLIDFVPNRAV
jgi:hypothetical protein